jgi:hypothetical protein
LSVHLINFEDFVDAIIDGRDLEILQFASETWVRYPYQELRRAGLLGQEPGVYNCSEQLINYFREFP